MIKKEKSLLSVLAALLVFLVFAAGILWVLLSGAGVYRRLNERSQGTYDSRTCAQYLASKVRQTSGSVQAETFDGLDALVIREELDGTACLTRVYCCDGWLRELFTTADGDFSPEDGEKLLPLHALSVKNENGLLRFCYETLQGNTGLLTLTVPTGKEAQP